MKRQKRWESEAEIIAAIDDARATADSLLEKSRLFEKEIAAAGAGLAQLEQKAHKTPKIEGEINQLRFNIKQWREQVGKNNKRATRIIDVKLVKLKGVLAAFQTVPMTDILGEDLAVVSP